MIRLVQTALFLSCVSARSDPTVLGSATAPPPTAQASSDDVPPNEAGIQWVKLPKTAGNSERSTWVARLPLTEQQVRAITGVRREIPDGDESRCQACAATSLTWCDSASIVNLLQSAAGYGERYSGLPAFDSPQAACAESAPVVVRREGPGYDLPTLDDWKALWMSRGPDNLDHSTLCTEVGPLVNEVPAEALCSTDQVLGVCGLRVWATYSRTFGYSADDGTFLSGSSALASPAGDDVVALVGTGCRAPTQWDSQQSVERPEVGVVWARDPTVGLRLAYR